MSTGGIPFGLSVADITLRKSVSVTFFLAGFLETGTNPARFADGPVFAFVFEHFNGNLHRGWG